MNVVLFREGNVWIAQGLEHNLVAQGRTLPEVKDAFARVFGAQVLVDLADNLVPLSTCGSAPQEYWDLFDAGEPFYTQFPDRMNAIFPSRQMPVPRGECRINA